MGVLSNGPDRGPVVKTNPDEATSSNSSPVPSVRDGALMDPDSGVKRGLKNRHVSMMAFAGIIGPGLLVGTGGALESGGPAGLLIGFGVVGMIAFSIMQSLGEMTTLYPGGGSFISLGDRLVDKAFAVAVGCNYFLIWAFTLANEYNVVSSIFSVWSPQVPIWAWFIVFWSAFMAFQMFGVQAFGEAEFWLALIKILGLSVFYVFAIVYTAGGLVGQDEALGFRYWRDPGPFNGHGFRGVTMVFVFCSSFYSGVESIAIAATETRNPGIAVPQAIRQIFWRIIFVYIGAAFFFGLTCPANAPDLISADAKAFQSPMTIALVNAGWKGGYNLINTFIFITCLSACNSSIYIGSRTLLYMANSGMMPRILGWTNKRGVPVYAIVLINAAGALSMMNVTKGGGKTYAYIINLSGVSAFIVWGSIGFMHIRFSRAWRAQGRDRASLPFKSMLYPYTMWFGFVANVFLALVQGWTTLAPFKAGKFVDAYILLPLFLIIFFGFKIVMKTKWRRIADIDLDSGRRMDLDSPCAKPEDREDLGADLPQETIWRRMAKNSSAG